MSFNTALSGLRAANQDLQVSGNNIANGSTVGFKRSRAEFGDVYANALVGGSAVAGSGVLVTDIAQQFGQGNVSFTDNSLDLAINGQGFFILNDGGARAYTRAGSFGLDNQGFIVGNGGARLQGFQAVNGVISDGVLTDLQIDTAPLAPNQTSSVDIEFNLDSRLAGIDPVAFPFDPTNADSFHDSTSSTIYDSHGNPHVLTKYFIKRSDNVWDINLQINGQDVGTPVDGTGAQVIGGTPTSAQYQVTFNTSGELASMVRVDYDAVGTFVQNTPVALTAGMTINNWDPGTGANSNTSTPVTSAFNIDLTGSTQFGEDTTVSSVDQDGFAPGRLANVEVSDTGVVFARYTNGESLTLGRLALAQFANPQGLTPLGETSWAESFESGQPIDGNPQSGSLGSIQSGALEESNVELSEELVRLIIAQRNYQANAKTIETADTVTQAVINIR